MAWRGESLPVPAETIAVVRAAAGRVVERVIAAVRAESPGYAHVLGGPEGIGLQLGIERAIATFLDAVERGEPPAGDTAEMWRALGEAEFQAGRSLEAVRAAFRTGTRAAWRAAADLAAEAGVSAPVVIALAEAIFVYTDSLASDVVEGYLRMQSDEAGERERRRRRVAALLVDGEHFDPDAMEHAAELARWAVPARVAAVALDSDALGPVTRRLRDDVLAGVDGGAAYLLVPDPDGPGRRGELTRALGGVTAALGPAVALRDAGRSLGWARATLALGGQGLRSPDGPAVVDEHVAALLMLADPALARRLVSTRLGPLMALPASERERLTATLAAWLSHQRHTPGIAAELHVHPQTVRYRMGRLHELLGGALDTPDGRFELELALRARAALGE